MAARKVAKKKNAKEAATAKKRTPPTKAAPKKAAPKKAAPKKAATAKKRSAPKKAAAAAKKRSAPKKRVSKRAAKAASKSLAPTRSPASVVPEARASQRVLAACAQLPTERALTDEERVAMEKVADAALRLLGERPEHGPERIVDRIATFVDEVRAGRRTPPGNADLRLGIGVLWGQQVRARADWRWVHLTYPDGFASYALVPSDRAFACFPLNRLPELMARATGVANTTSTLYACIRGGDLPARKKNAYLVIG